MTIISIGRVSHLTSAELEAELREQHENEVIEGRSLTISDRAAVTIAGFFAGPSAASMPFTVLAQQGVGRTDELGSAILEEQGLHKTPTHPTDSLMTDGFLQAWHLLEELDWWVGGKE